jgi:hypothetical protein
MKSILLATIAAVVMTTHCQAADIRFIPASTSAAPDDCHYRYARVG